MSDNTDRATWPTVTLPPSWSDEEYALIDKLCRADDFISTEDARSVTRTLREVVSDA